MASNKVSECCTQGTAGSKTHQLSGTTIKMGSIDTYVVAPPSTPQGALLLLPDGFGLVMHNFILADLFAKQGWAVFVPDYFQGNTMPEAYLRRNPDLSIDDQVCWSDEDRAKMRDFDLDQWAATHSPDFVNELLARLIPLVKAQLPSSATPLFAVGYCFGGKYVFTLAGTGHIQAGAVFHPSWTNINDTKGTNCPILIGAAEQDHLTSLSLCQELKVSLKDQNVAVELHIYDGVGHGFASRPNTEDLLAKKQFERAFGDANMFFKKLASERTTAVGCGR
ncbi:Alpha/Beta hydrolase protein [Xylogone sp. PMI_703]|nr:Alpha/Beta hydrolase protein [Xylogone sp. PMI_703]